LTHTLFISDLHLSEARAPITRLFLDFLERTVPWAEALYILGDLFEFWVGDDDIDSAFNTAIVQALRRLRDRGTALYFMRGNRDFLIAETFAEASGAVLLPDPHLTTLYGTPTLLMHGDLLCTDDVRYQAFRRQVRQPEAQAAFLRRPLAERHAIVGDVKGINEREKNAKPEAVMDVSPQAVAEALRRGGYPRLIHGHTHRPGHHVHQVDSVRCERWVLTDWYGRGGYLQCDAAGCTAFPLAPCQP
jgi:UDP-2,3-diacylglucosamine hydrolase